MVFDLDNTLVHRDQAMLDCIESSFSIELSSTQKKAIEEKDEEGHADRILFCIWLKSFLKIRWNPMEIWELIRKNIGFFVTLDHNAKIVLSQIKLQYELVLLTNGGIENQQRKIVQTGLNQFFSFNKIFISEALGYDKPDPKSFQCVEDQYHENTSFIMIGDHWENDILGAHQVGWKAIYLNQEQQKTKIENVKIISSLLSLKKVLNEFE